MQILHVNTGGKRIEGRFSRWGMKKINVLLMLLVLVISTAALAKPSKEAKEYWEETDLDFTVLRLVLNQNCFSSDKEYLACYTALDTLERLSSNRGTLVPEKFYNSHQEEYGTIIANYSPLLLVNLKKKTTGNKVEAIEAWKKSKKLEAAVNKAVMAIRTTSQKINFEGILKEVSQNATYQTKPQSQIAAAFNSYLGIAFDPHTHLNPSEEIMAQYEGSDESFVGIGIVMKEFNGRVLVQRVIPGGGADISGMKKNDIITHIDNVASESIPFTEIPSLIRGKENTVVNLVVQRGESQLKLSVTRKPVTLPNVQSELMRDQNLSIGYIKLGTFMEKSGCEKISKAITQLEQKQVNGLVLDLRGNPGGLLDQAVCIVGLFVDKGKVAVKVKDLNRNEFQDYKTGFDLAGRPFPNYPVTTLPMVVLIDSGSASASEIVAGALQDHKRAWIVGDRSFGKGTVQTVVPFRVTSEGFDIGRKDPMTEQLRPAQFVLSLTIQRFYQPSGSTNQMVGIIPDFNVPVKLNATEEDTFALREEDLYSNALVAVNPPPAAARPADVQKIGSCVKGLGSTPSSVDLNDDYQLYNAGKIMTCSLQQGIKIQRR